jgi:hypothetical protein
MICFIGARKRTGKDTFVKYSCIEEARHITDRLFPNFETQGSKKDTPVEEYNNKTYRQTVIDIVDVCLKTDPYCFSKNLVRMHKAFPDKFFIVSDLRRKEEMDFYKEELDHKDRLFFLIENPSVPKEESYGEGSIDDHELWDAVIYNDSTLSQLERIAKRIAEDIQHQINNRLALSF